MIRENTPELETERLILRKLADSSADMEALFAILRDEATNVFLPWFLIRNMEEAKAHARKRFFDFYAKDSAYRYVICMKTDNRPIGYVCLGEGESFDFGYGLRSDFWHRGIVTEAAQKVMERIQAAGYPYITATHDVNNPRSGNVMKKIGMEYCYSYRELWMPKRIPVTFRLYQRNFDGGKQVYRGYWERYPEHFVETAL